MWERGKGNGEELCPTRNRSLHHDLSSCALWFSHSHPTAKVSEQMNTKYPLGTRFHSFQPSTPIIGLSQQTLQLLNHIRRCYLANKLKPYCERVNRRDFHVWNSHRQRAAELFQTTLYYRLILSNSWAS